MTEPANGLPEPRTLFRSPPRAAPPGAWRATSSWDGCVALLLGGSWERSVGRIAAVFAVDRTQLVVASYLAPYVLGRLRIRCRSLLAAEVELIQLIRTGG